MAQFDPRLRRETWLFSEVKRDAYTGLPIYRRLPYTLVSYDGDPDQIVEPMNQEPIGTHSTVVRPEVDGAGLVIGFQFVQGRPFEAFSLNDNVGD